MASSADYADSKFNLAAQGERQPGSSFKVFALMTALRNGVNPNTHALHVGLADAHQRPALRRAVRHQDLRRHERRQHEPVPGDAAVRQLGLHPARARPRPRQGGRHGGRHGHQAPRTCTAIRPSRSAASRTASRRWRWPPRTRRSPPAATATGRPRSPRSTFEGTGRSELPRRWRPHRTKVFPDGVTYEATKILEANIQGGTGTHANIGCPAGGKTGTDRPQHRRLVRRLHAAPGDRRLGRLPQRPHPDERRCTSAARSTAARSRPTSGAPT